MLVYLSSADLYPVYSVFFSFGNLVRIVVYTQAGSGLELSNPINPNTIDIQSL